jgi:hypothetical protein
VNPPQTNKPCSKREKRGDSPKILKARKLAKAKGEMLESIWVYRIYQDTPQAP